MVFLCICEHVNMVYVLHVCVHVCVCTNVCMCMHMYISVCMWYVYECVYEHMSMYMCARVCVCMCVCMRVCAYVYTCTCMCESLTDTTQAMTSTIHWGLTTTYDLRNSLVKCWREPSSCRNWTAWNTCSKTRVKAEGQIPANITWSI